VQTLELMCNKRVTDDEMLGIGKKRFIKHIPCSKKCSDKGRCCTCISPFLQCINKLKRYVNMNQLFFKWINLDEKTI
jgi:hypothetical protein